MPLLLVAGGILLGKIKVLTLTSKDQLLANNNCSQIGYNRPFKLTLGQ